MKPPLTRDELAKLVEEALEGGGYLMFRFGHGQIRQLRPDETEIVLGALKTPAPEVAEWKPVHAPLERQVAWIDRDARYVAVVDKGQEYLLQLPSRPQSRSET